MKNSQHLKAYVQMHPENKMAWYLLGKEYYKNGQHGKANYCFNQAGEVYEAFEHSKVPAEMLREYEEGLLQAGRERDRQRQKIRRTLLVLALLLLLVIPSAVAPGYIQQGEGAYETALDAENSNANSEGIADTPVAADPESVPATAKAKPSFTALEGGGASSAGRVLAKMLGSSKPSSRTAVLGMERSGKWLLWKEKLPLISTLEKTGDGRIEYQSYEPAVCACEPPEHGKLTQQAGEWQATQEELATLWSAIKGFRNQKGRLPDSLKELTGPFPGNWLGGTTPAMKTAFAPLKAAAGPMTDEGTPGQTAVPSATPAAEIQTGEKGTSAGAGSSSKEKLFFTEPLTIIVDKQTHRLAITSGSVMLRNYEVGLGGDKTPEGSFVITDKVVNPNGHDNGEFGSRGLQLSETNYAIHGTNEADSIGKDESLGCIRMKREDVEELFAMVPKGTKVQITKGVLPAELLLPKERFSPAASHDQTNPHKKYHWLN